MQVGDPEEEIEKVAQAGIRGKWATTSSARGQKSPVVERLFPGRTGRTWPFSFVTCGCALCYSRKGNEPHATKQGVRKCGQGQWVSWC